MAFHRLNLYEVENLDDLRASYRLVEIDGSFGIGRPEEDLAERNLSVLVKQVAYQEKVPVALLRQGNQALLAVPGDLALSRHEYTLAPDVVSLKPRDEVREVRFGELSPRTETIGSAFLRYALRTPLMHNHELWSTGATSYFSKRPVNEKRAGGQTDIYGGFGFRLVTIDRKLYLALWLTYTYADHRWLTDRFTEAQIRSLHMRHLLYHFGDRWFCVQLLDLTGKSIRDAKFSPDGGKTETNVYDYTLTAAGPNAPFWIRTLDPGSSAIVYQYPGNKKRAFGAAALSKLRLSTEDPDVRALHKLSIKSPEERFRLTGELVGRYFSNARLGNVPVRISPEPLSVRPKVFAVPKLQFGQNRQLSVDNAGSGKGVALRDLPKARMDCLLGRQGGLAVTGALDAQYLLVPEQLPRSIAEDFQERFQHSVSQFLGRPFRMELILYADEDARTLKQQVDAIRAAIGSAGADHGHAVLVLPENAKPDLHNYIKRALHGTVQTQCVSATRLKEFYEPASSNGQGKHEVPRAVESRYASYLRYTALGLLIVNRQWPWVLSEPTRYDIYIGVDVLNNTAAFVFFYEGGRNCFVRSHPCRQKEKLSRKQMASVIHSHLREDLSGSSAPRPSIIVRRDGRTYESEWLGLQDAVRQLVKEGVLPKDVVFGIVEIHKHTAMGLRIAAETQNRDLRNPKIGSWFAINEREGIVCTTGYPFELRGTANPLGVGVARGNLNLAYVLEDTFRMSQLCWPVPDRCMRLPIDIKLCDDFLRSTAGHAEDDEAMYGEVFSGSEEGDDTSAVSAE
jgi:hypothetical protein